VGELGTLTAIGASLAGPAVTGVDLGRMRWGVTVAAPSTAPPPGTSTGRPIISLARRRNPALGGERHRLQYRNTETFGND